MFPKCSLNVHRVAQVVVEIALKKRQRAEEEIPHVHDHTETLQGTSAGGTSPRFLVDPALGKLGRWLRCLGLDVASAEQQG